MGKRDGSGDRGEALQKRGGSSRRRGETDGRARHRRMNKMANANGNGSISKHSGALRIGGFIFVLGILGLFGKFVIQLTAVGNEDGAYIRQLDRKMKNDEAIFNELVSAEVSPQQNGGVFVYEGDKSSNLLWNAKAAIRKRKKEMSSDIARKDKAAALEIKRIVNDWKKNESPLDNELAKALKADNPNLRMLAKRQSAVEAALNKLGQIESVTFEDIKYEGVRREGAEGSDPNSAEYGDGQINQLNEQEIVQVNAATLLGIDTVNNPNIQQLSKDGLTSNNNDGYTTLASTSRRAAQNSFIRSLRKSASYTASVAKQLQPQRLGSGIIGKYLLSLGYASRKSLANGIASAKEREKLPQSKWQISLGAKCPNINRFPDATVFMCTTLEDNNHVSLPPQFLPYDAFLATAQQVRESPNQDLRELLELDSFLPATFKLSDEEARLELEKKVSTSTDSYTILFRGGLSRPQFTQDLKSVLRSNKLRHVESNVILQQHIKRPFIWSERAATFRTFAVLLSVNPLQALYHTGVVIRSSDKYIPVVGGAGSASMSGGSGNDPRNGPWKSHFPGLMGPHASSSQGGNNDQTSTNGLSEAVYSSWDEFRSYVLAAGMVGNDHDFADRIIAPRLKQLTAFAVLAVAQHQMNTRQAETTSATTATAGGSKSKSLVIQHVCVDFVLDHNLRPWIFSVSHYCAVPSIKTSPKLRSAHNAMSVNTLKVVEEALYARQNGKPMSVNMMTSSSLGELQVLINQIKSGNDEGVQRMIDESLLRDVNMDAERREQNKFLPNRKKQQKKQESNPTSKRQVSSDVPATVCEGAELVSFRQTGQDDVGKVWTGLVNGDVPACDGALLRDLFSTSHGATKDMSIDTSILLSSKIETDLPVSVTLASRHQWKEAVHTANNAQYTLCRLWANHALSLVWQPELRGNAHLAVKVIRCKGHPVVHPLTLEVPHPFFDRTRAQGLQLFSRGNARAVLMSGSHRCASAPLSGCTGSVNFPIKTNCGVEHTAYTNADVAHSVRTTFFTLHKHWVDVVATDDLIVSLHSTKQESLVISDGTSHPANPSSTVVRLGIELAKVFTAQVHRCNPSVGVGGEVPTFLPESERTICGATNVQGRHMNGAVDVCTGSFEVSGDPLKASGRFVHIEQPVELVKSAAVTATVHHFVVAIHQYFVGKAKSSIAA